MIDEDGCYDPAEFNDSLVLGMKGTFAQAELHIIRARLHGGKLNKAAKGELRFALPVGLVWDGDQIVLDPDQEVRGAVRMVFDLFARESTAFGVVQRFNELGLRPRRAYGGAWDGKLIWGRLTHSRVLGVLANPSYAGLYVFGRYQSSKEVEPSGEIRSRSRLMPQDAWRIVIPDHHEGYISADQFVVNRERLAANRTNCEGLAGPVREGFCLLQGLLLCGVRSPSRRPLYRQWRPLPDLSMCVEAPRGFGTPRLPQCPVSAARSGHHGSLGQRHHAGDDRARAQSADEPGGAGSRDRRAVADADRAGAL